jgi:hypothetical protein
MLGVNEVVEARSQGWIRPDGMQYVIELKELIMNKRSAPKGEKQTKPPVPNPGFYGAQVGSPQNVEFGKGSNLNYLKPSEQRAEMIGGGRSWPMEKARELAAFNGGGTFRFKDRKTIIEPLANPKI